MTVMSSQIFPRSEDDSGPALLVIASGRRIARQCLRSHDPKFKILHSRKSTYWGFPAWFFWVQFHDEEKARTFVRCYPRVILREDLDENQPDLDENLPVYKPTK